MDPMPPKTKRTIVLVGRWVGWVVTKFIKTGTADKNDYPLYFDKVFYEVDIDENVEINHNFLNVTAKTHGEVCASIGDGIFSFKVSILLSMN
uniref:Uncharacterized protein n=1 Tax=Anopheles arabiensis TaxID=7173 RepID=A0A182HWZ3_ANOAR